MHPSVFIKFYQYILRHMKVFDYRTVRMAICWYPLDNVDL